MNNYEAMIIIKPELSEEEKKEVLKQIDEAVVKNKGTVSQASIWGERKKLCFPIKKHQEGTYYLLNFTAPSAAVGEMKNTYRLNENILRVLITRMDK